MLPQSDRTLLLPPCQSPASQPESCRCQTDGKTRVTLSHTSRVSPLLSESQCVSVTLPGPPSPPVLRDSSDSSSVSSPSTHRPYRQSRNLIITTKKTRGHMSKIRWVTCQNSPARDRLCKAPHTPSSRPRHNRQAVQQRRVCCLVPITHHATDMR